MPCPLFASEELSRIERFRLPVWAIVAAVIAVELVVFSAMALAARQSPTDGMVVREGVASIEATSQSNVLYGLTVSRVVAPDDAWVYVQADEDGTPGMAIGVKRVPAGENTNVQVPVDGFAGLPQNVIVTLVADGGKPGVFELDMSKMTGSPDKPFVADGKNVSASFSIAPFGVGNENFTAVLEPPTRTGAASEVVVPGVFAPSPSWLVVTSVDPEKGKPGKVLGTMLVPQGYAQDLRLPIEATPKGQQLRVVLYADLGKQGVFEFDPANLAQSSDKPYVAGGAVVAAPVTQR